MNFIKTILENRKIQKKLNTITEKQMICFIKNHFENNESLKIESFKTEKMIGLKYPTVVFSVDDFKSYTFVFWLEENVLYGEW